MKILFLSEGSHTQDYLRDCLFHGLRSLVGPDVVDVRKLISMYVGADRSQMYGLGFTLYAELPDIEVDRDDIPKKIRDRYFDIIVYGSVHRHHDYLHEVMSKYPPERVVFIDGEDHTSYLKGLSGLYFKRELHNPQAGVFPIQFAVPKQKILSRPPVKDRLMSPMDPIDKSTYIYKTEQEYYAQYAESYYAPTMKKGGWDCLRHYEIISQWCIPYFRCFDQCPPTIMANAPRKQLRLVQELFDHSSLSPASLKSIYHDLINPIMESMMTTESLAHYVLDKIGVREMACR